MFSAEERILCLCTRQQLSAENESALHDLLTAEPIDWNNLFETANRHGVAPLVGHNLLQCTTQFEIDIPAPIDKRFKMVKMRNTVAKRKRIDAVTAALPLFATGHVAVMPVKGAALDLLVYDQFWYMTSDDLDLVFDVSDEGAFSAEISTILPDLVAAKVEYDFYSHHDVTMNDTLPVDFDTIWRDAHIGDWHGEPVHLMSWEDMLIAVCVNSCRKRYFRLKAVCDVAETVLRADALDWDAFLRKVGDYDCGAIVYAALKATALTVGHSMSDAVVAALPVSGARRMLIDRLAGRMSLSAFDSIYAGRVVFGRNLDPALMLQYATLRNYQLRRKAGFVWHTRERQTVKTQDE